jgi:hypothetical protein
MKVGIWVVVSGGASSITTAKEHMSKKDVVPNVGQQSQGWMVVGEACKTDRQQKPNAKDAASGWILALRGRCLWEVVVIFTSMWERVKYG